MPGLFFWRGHIDRVFALSPVQAEADDKSGHVPGIFFCAE